MLPQATTAGTVFYGNMLLGQMITHSATSLSHRITLSVQEMILASYSNEGDLRDINLLSAVVNNNLVNNAVRSTVSVYELAKLDVQNEMIHYCVIQNAGQNLSTGANMPFMLNGHIEANAIFYPDITDIPSNNLFRPMHDIVVGVQKLPQPSSPQDLVHAHKKHKKPAWKDAWDYVRKVVSQNKGTIMSMAMKGLTSLATGVLMADAYDDKDPYINVNHFKAMV
jgi:hypothetical protein